MIEAAMVTNFGSTTMACWPYAAPGSLIATYTPPSLTLQSDAPASVQRTGVTSPKSLHAGL